MAEFTRAESLPGAALRVSLGGTEAHCRTLFGKAITALQVTERLDMFDADVLTFWELMMGEPWR